MALSINYNLVSSGDFQANAVELGDQLTPDVLGLSNGGFVVAYTSDGFTQPVHLEFYDADGQKVEDAVIPYDSENLTVGQPSLTELANGNVLVVWDDDAFLNADLKGRLFTPEGVPIGDEIFLTGGSTSTLAEDPQVTALTGGGFVVSFGYEHDIYQAVYDDFGELVSDENFGDQINTETNRPHVDSAVTALADGGYVITWTHLEPLFNQEIRCRVFNADGSPRTDDFQISIAGFHNDSAVAGLPNGNFAVVYTDTGWANESGSTGITMQIFDADGDDVTPGLGAIHVNTPGIKDESDPDITVLPNGYIVVTWTRDAGGANPDIVGRIFDQNGQPVTVNGDADEFFINGAIGQPDGDVLSAVSSMLGGQFVTSWQDESTDGDGGQIRTSVKEIVRTVNGDGADDTFNGDELRDFVNGYSGNDTLNGDKGDDTLNGGANDDTLNGGADNDTLIGQDGNDTLAGGSGVDTASYVGAIAGVTVALSVAAAQNTVGDGTDTLSSVENLIGSNFVDTLSGTSGDNTVSGGGNNDTLTGYSGNDTLNGDNGNDSLNGGANNDTLNGGENNDTLIGQDGNDTLNGGNGIDTASYVGAVAGVTVALSVATAQNTAGDGNDTLSSIENLIGSNFADTLSGTAGDNTISGGGNNDNVKGYAGDDILNGDNGNDTLNGGANNDTLNGAENNDTLIGQDGNDTLAGGNGTDTASYVGATSGVTVSLSVAGAQNTGGDGIDTLTGIENLIGSGTGDTLSGTSGNNTLTGNGGDDALTGYSGIDVLNGDAGDDTLNGGANNDTLSGGGNGDTLIGQDGNDTLSGGGGADDFIFDDAHGVDIVTDFQNGADQFDLRAVGGVDDIGDLTIIDNGATVTVNYGTGSFTIANLADAGQLDASDFLF